jgi:hypothetical protein
MGGSRGSSKSTLDVSETSCDIVRFVAKEGMVAQRALRNSGQYVSLDEEGLAKSSIRGTQMNLEVCNLLNATVSPAC